MKNVTSFNSSAASGRLPKTGEAYALSPLTKADVREMTALEQRVRDTLGAEEQHALHQRDESFFNKFFETGNIAVGVRMQPCGTLVAQSLLVLPEPGQPGLGDMKDFRLEARPEETCVIEGVLVDPGFRGNNLMAAMLNWHIAEAQQIGREHIVAETTVENGKSWGVFLKQGLQIHSIGYDPQDKVSLYNMHGKVGPLMERRLKQIFNATATVQTPKDDLAQQRKLLENGYKGIEYDPQSGMIGFREEENRAANANIPPSLPRHCANP